MRLLPCLLAIAACGGHAAPAETPVTVPPPPAPAPARPAPTGVKQYDVATFFKNVSVAAAGFSHDGSKALVSMDSSGVFNVYAIPTAGGAPQRLTTSDTSQFAVGYFPADDRVLYSQDGGGDELSHLYVLDHGQAVDLTPGAKVKAQFGAFSTDGAWFWVSTNERDPKAFDVYRYASKDYKRELIYTNKDGYAVGDVSSDGRWLALSKVRNNSDSDVFLVDLKKKAAPKKITAHKGDVSNDVEGFTPDGKALWYRTDGEGEFEQAWSYDLASGKRKQEIAAEWDVERVGFSKHGRYRISVINEDAKLVLRVVDTQSGKDVVLPETPNADVSAPFFSEDETRMGYMVISDRTPGDLYVVDIGKQDAPRQLTHALNPAIDPKDLVDSSVVRYPSADSLAIPAILYRPKDASAARKVPAVVLIHGGPGGQTRRGYSPMIQHLVNHGYAVLGVNNRGSSGYGKKFFHLDDRKHGEADLQDIVAARPYLASLDWVDGKRVAVMGGSYGGYLVGATLAFAPEVYDAGVDIFGVMNWVRTLESIPPWWAAQRESLYAELGNPATDKARLQKISPLFHAENIKRPLLVVQGKNDPRVLKAESDEIVAAVKKNGVPVEYLVFDDEGHGFLKQKNKIAAQEAYLKFLDAHLSAK